MNKMMKMCVVAAMGAAVAGCGKQRYEDPQAFMEGPGNEALCKWHEDGMYFCGFSGFKFKNAKVEMDFGREMACADFMLVPKKGQKFYRLINLAHDDRGLLCNPTNSNECCEEGIASLTRKLLPVVEGKEFQADMKEAQSVLWKVSNYECRPVFYGSEVKGKDLESVLNTGYRVRIPRLKDGEGVYRVVEDHNLVDYVGNGPNNWRPNSRGDRIGKLICTEAITGSKLLDIASAEAKTAISMYVNGCMKLKEMLSAMQKSMIELRDLKDGYGRDEMVEQYCKKDPIASMAKLRFETCKLTIPTGRTRQERQAQAARLAVEKKAAQADYDKAMANVRKKVEAECAKQAAAKEQDVKTLLREVRKLLGLPETRAAGKQG